LTDLLARTAELVDIASPSHGETALADRIERELRGHAHLVVDRLGDNVVARTMLGRPTRLVFAGTVSVWPASTSRVGRPSIVRATTLSPRRSTTRCA